MLEQVGLIERSRSSGDGRRRYVHLRQRALDGLVPGKTVAPTPALFVCSANSARSQLAAALWRRCTGQPATSAGTHPAPRVHPGAIAAATRAGLDLGGASPRALTEVADHWSIPDPVPVGTKAAFDAAVAELTDRIRTVTAGTST